MFTNHIELYPREKEGRHNQPAVREILELC